MPWYSIFNDVFWLSITPVVLGFLALCVRYAYRSKCTHVRLCCGCLEIEREVAQELDDDDVADVAGNAGNAGASATSASSV